LLEKGPKNESFKPFVVILHLCVLWFVREGQSWARTEWNIKLGLMFSALEQLDWKVSLAINHWRSDGADIFMAFITQTWPWIPLYAVLIGLIVYCYRKENAWWLPVLGVVALVGLADWTSVHFFKDVICRFRPSHTPELEGLLYLPDGKGGLYGFISSHAANCFAIAAYVTFVLKGRFRFFRSGIMYLWAVLIAYSRVYLGKHFFGDVLCGAIWGVLLAFLMWRLIRLLLSRYYPSVLQSPVRLPKK